jgi:hypothetical protein
MAVKSIIDVEVNDAAFKSFSALYEKYQKALEKAPGAWAAATKEVQAQRKGFEAIAAAILAQNDLTRRAVAEQKTAGNELERSSRFWREMAQSTKNFASNIKDATVSLLRWGAISGVISGLVGAGGLWGIDRLALGVGASRRSALGLGLGIGEQKAFAANFARLVDPEAFLGSVAGARLDVTKRVGLLGAGLTPGEMAGDTAQTAIALLRHLKQIADTTNPALYGQVITARRLDQFVSAEDLQRLRATTPGEFNELIRRYGANRGQFDLPPDVARGWQEFATQMSRAGQGIENTFVRGLAPLTPGLAKLSEGVEKVIHAFLGSPSLEKWITMADQALEKFAGYIGTDEFATKVEDFVKGLGELANAVGAAASWIFSKTPAGAETGGILGEREGHETWNEMVRGAARLRAGGEAASLLSLIRRLEGSSDTAISPRGAIGRYQIMPETAASYGFDPSKLTNPAYNEQVAKAVLADLVKQYHGNLDEVLVGYNASSKVRNRFIASGDDPSVLPAETRRYLERAHAYDKETKVIVEIHNSTGANAAVTVNGLKN